MSNQPASQTRAHALQVEIGDDAHVVVKVDHHAGRVHLHIEDSTGLAVVSMTITADPAREIQDGLRIVRHELDRIEAVEATHHFYGALSASAEYIAAKAGWVADGNVVLGDE